MMERLNCDDPARVEQEIRDNDEAHAAVVRRNCGLDWRDPNNYDVVLNTARLPIEGTAEELLSVTRQAIFNETDESRQMLLDLRLKARIRVALRVNPPTRNTRIDVQVCNGHVKLTGIVKDEQQRLEVIRVVNAAQAVESMTSELRMADGFRPWGNG